MGRKPHVTHCRVPGHGTRCEVARDIAGDRKFRYDRPKWKRLWRRAEEAA